jgi:predicted kinase
VLLITGTVGAGKTAVAREVGELLRLTRVAGGMKMACGVIDLDALSYVAPGPVGDRFHSEFVLENLEAVWPNYAARGVDHLVLARYVGAAHEVEAYRKAIPSATVTVCRVTAPAETVRDRLRRRECGIARDFLMALSRTLAAEIDELALEDFVVDNGPDRSVTDVAREVAERVGWPVPPATLDSSGQ